MYETNGKFEYGKVYQTRLKKKNNKKAKWDFGGAVFIGSNSIRGIVNYFIVARPEIKSARETQKSKEELKRKIFVCYSFGKDNFQFEGKKLIVKDAQSIFLDKSEENLLEKMLSDRGL